MSAGGQEAPLRPPHPRPDRLTSAKPGRPATAAPSSAALRASRLQPGPWARPRTTPPGRDRRGSGDRRPNHDHHRHILEDLGRRLPRRDPHPDVQRQSAGDPPVARANDKAPDHRNLAGQTEVGAAWTVSHAGKPECLSVRIDDPSFAAPPHALLAEVEDRYELRWSRRPQA